MIGVIVAMFFATSIFLVGRLATWAARRDFIESDGMAAYKRGMAKRGYSVPDEFPSFWKFAFSRLERNR